MNWTTRSINGLVWISLGALAAAAMGQAPAAAPFVTHQLKPNVYWIEGGGGNSTVIIGDKGVIVVDVKVSKAGGQELLEDIAKITPKPVTTVILTHSDGDHINGLAAFPTGLKIIAQENNKKEQEAAIAAGGPGAPSSANLPNQVVSKSKETVTIEGEKLELYHWAPAHTSGDLVVYLPTEKIVVAGDILIGSDPYPRIHDEKHGSTEGWIATAKGMAALESDTFIAGHGPVMTKAETQTRIAAAIERRDKIKAMVADGKSLDEINAGFADPTKRNYKSWTQVCYEELTKK
jgi:glyoxylase-like metal-dependent hydrolase (beta-lactamase superfamily II)